MADYLGDFPASFTTVPVYFTTHDGNGAPVAPLTAFEAADVKLYKNGSNVERSSTSGWTMTSPFDSIVGLHCLLIDLSDNTDAGFYAAGSTYSAVLNPDTETVNGQTALKVLATFTIGMNLRSTTNGRTLDVASTGEAGLDFDNIHDASGAHTLTNITVPTVTTTATVTAVTTVNGLAAGVITATSIAADAITAAKIAPDAIGASELAADAVAEIQSGLATSSALATVQADTDDIQSRLPTALTAGGKIKASTDEILAVAVSTTTAQLGVNVVQAGATAWNSGAIKTTSFTAGAIDAAAIGTDAIDADALKADAVTEIQSGLATPTNITAGTITTVTNLTNAPANGDLTATMKTSVTTAATAATPTAAAVTGNVGGNLVGSVGSLSTQAKADVNAEADTALADYDGPTHAELTSELATADDATLAAIAALNNLSQANIRTAVGLASANLDTQLDALPTNAELATALGGADDAVLAAIDALPTAAENRVEMDSNSTKLANLDATISSRTKPADTQAAVTLVATVTNLTNAPANGDLTAAMKASVNAEVDTAIADVGLTSTITGRIDAAISTRLASAGYTAPDNATITLINNKTTNLPPDPADASDVAGAFTVVNSNISTVNSNVLAVKAKTDNLPASPAATGDIPTANITAIKNKTDSLTFTISDELDVNIHSVNNVAVNGDGAATPWGP